jgi:glycosyltransferase involved in cell wall biosynthesis
MVGEPVGVVIPTYNRAALLQAALESVLVQTVPVQEIVVVDDGSTDETARVVAEFAAQGAPLRFFPGPHQNRRSLARNQGFAATSAPLVAFLDSDDLWRPARLARQLAALAAAPAAGFAFCNLQRFDEQGLIEGPCLDPARDYNGAILGDILEEPRIVSSTLLVRRAAFEAVGGFADLRMNEDHELTIRLAARYPASYIPEVLVLLREHAGRTSRAARELPLSDYIHIVGDFLAAHPDLPAATRARGRRGLANVHLKLARFYLESGERAAARRHVRATLGLGLWNRRTLQAALRAWAPGRSLYPQRET